MCPKSFFSVYLKYLLRDSLEYFLLFSHNQLALLGTLTGRGSFKICPSVSVCVCVCLSCCFFFRFFVSGLLIDALVCRDYSYAAWWHSTSVCCGSFVCFRCCCCCCRCTCCSRCFIWQLPRFSFLHFQFPRPRPQARRHWETENCSSHLVVQPQTIQVQLKTLTVCVCVCVFVCIVYIIESACSCQ